MLNAKLSALSVSLFQLSVTTDDRGQVRMVRNQLANSSLELDRAHHANLEAEIAQRATQIVLDVEGLGLQKLQTGQQHAALLAGQRLHMHRSVQANTHHLCNAARIVAVALVDLCRQRRLHMPMRCTATAIAVPPQGQCAQWQALPLSEPRGSAPAWLR